MLISDVHNQGVWQNTTLAVGEKGEIMYLSGRLELAAVTNCPESQCLGRAHVIFQLCLISWLLYTGYIIECPSSLQDPNS